LLRSAANRQRGKKYPARNVAREFTFRYLLARTTDQEDRTALTTDASDERGANGERDANDAMPERA